METSCRLTIFEGPDGAGKTTAARAFAEATNARYVHFPALAHVSHGLGRMYVEAMLPALLGYQDVVFDRSWLSEVPYGNAFRGGRDRLGDARRRMLERLAMRCGAVVVNCAPPWEVVRANYLARQSLEMLETDAQLQQVYEAYQGQSTALPIKHYDYTLGRWPGVTLDDLRYARHPLDVASAGNWQAPTVLVGASFAERKDHDAWYQWPFASFDGVGCSQWLTNQLPVAEDQLLWLNADQDLSVLHDLSPTRVIALGGEACQQLYNLKIMANRVLHPQAHKQFHTAERYSLIDLLGAI